MTIASFIKCKQLDQYSDCYLQFETLVRELNLVCELEREKYYSLDFKIISPQDSEDDRYHVLPVVSNEEFKEKYHSFLMKLRDELDRVDKLIASTIQTISNEMEKCKWELSLNSGGYLTWFRSYSPWTTTNFNSNSNFSTNSSNSKSNNSKSNLMKLETQLKLIRSNVIIVNKFALSHLIKLKKQYLKKSKFPHLLLQVELGEEVPPLPSPFPIKGKRNRHHFPTINSPPKIAITQPSSSTDNSTENSTENLNHQLDRVNFDRLNLNRLNLDRVNSDEVNSGGVNPNLNLLPPTTTKLTPPPNLKLTIPTPPPPLNSTLTTLSSFSSSSHHLTPDLISRTSTSTLSTLSSHTTTHSSSSLLLDTPLWSLRPHQIDSLLKQCQSLRSTQSTLNLRSRLSQFI